MLGLQFHWYGFLIGLGVLAGTSLTEYLIKKKNVPTEIYWQVVVVVIISGIIGSRIWHVATDLQLYVGHWQNVFAIWNGGLSIIGTVIGALISYAMYFHLHPDFKKYRLVLLDLSVFGLIVGQAIGRFGNYFNQELYGLPTNLPWAISIDPAHRIMGFEQFSTFHPLFAYEAIVLLFFFALAWKLQKNVLKVGTGLLFLLYIGYYSWIRFLLDFLRIDKAVTPFAGLGMNQIFLLVVAVSVSIYLFFKHQQLSKSV